VCASCAVQRGLQDLYYLRQLRLECRPSAHLVGAPLSAHEVFVLLSTCESLESFTLGTFVCGAICVCLCVWSCVHVVIAMGQCRVAESMLVTVWRRQWRGRYRRVGLYAR